MILYYFPGATYLWSDVANWYEDNGFTIPHAAIPLPGDECHTEADTVTLDVQVPSGCIVYSGAVTFSGIDPLFNNVIFHVGGYFDTTGCSNVTLQSSSQLLAESGGNINIQCPFIMSVGTILSVDGSSTFGIGDVDWTIGSGCVVTLDGSCAIGNTAGAATTTNDGTISSGGSVNWMHNLTSNGSFLLTGGGMTTNSGSNTVILGGMDISPGGTLSVSSVLSVQITDLNNYGGVINAPSGNMYVNTGASFNNYGSYDHYGIITIGTASAFVSPAGAVLRFLSASGAFNIDGGADLFVGGDIQVYTPINNTGTVTLDTGFSVSVVNPSIGGLPAIGGINLFGNTVPLGGGGGAPSPSTYA